MTTTSISELTVEDIRLIVGRRLKDAREGLNYTQNYVSYSVGILQSNYTNVEAGKVYPNPLTLLRLCKLLKIPIEELLDFRDYDIGVQDTESNPQRKDSKEKEEIRQKINGLQKVIDEMKKTTQIPLLESMVLELKKQL